MSGSTIASLQPFALPNKLQATKSASTMEATSDTKQTAEQKFLDYAKKSPAEKIRDALLNSVGVTEDQLKSMSPEQRKDVEQKIADKIKEAMTKRRNKAAAPAASSPTSRPDDNTPEKSRRP